MQVLVLPASFVNVGYGVVSRPQQIQQVQQLQQLQQVPGNGESVAASRSQCVQAGPPPGCRQPGLQTGLQAACTSRMQESQEAGKKAALKFNTSEQKRINNDLVQAGRCGTSALLRCISKNLGQMNGVNVATAFHRLTRDGDESLAGDVTFLRLMDTAELRAKQEQALQNGTMPANCCTIIAWSCAKLRAFLPSLFSVLASVAASQLGKCQAYEVTNLLWAFAEFHKYQQDAAGTLAKELQTLLDAMAENFMRRSFGDFKVQVLISAFMSASALPWSQSFSQTWLATSTFRELAVRWEELEAQAHAQVSVGLERLRVKCRPVFQNLRALASKFPDVAEVVEVVNENSASGSRSME
ncbi:unnamed protein product [Symbiodinium natans]|uniref:Uncharacterized protein n=1 Tax=Symbiodinium natans TaxID=878477 RepID=A0A812TNA6_9DINO|nr:unnamed protein product [Symbiodinium natans]